jgi:hypothetical protein
VPETKTQTSQQESSTAVFELLDAEQLAARLNLPETWVREMTRTRTSDPIPHLRFGRYVRFQWGSLALIEWISRRMCGGK